VETVFFCLKSLRAYKLEFQKEKKNYYMSNPPPGVSSISSMDTKTSDQAQFWEQVLNLLPESSSWVKNVYKKFGSNS